MKLGFQFSNLCGSVYKCGNVTFTPDGVSLLSPVGNRVTMFDLIEHTSITLPFECRKNIARITVSPDGRLLLAIDEDGYALVVNLKRHIILHRFNFKGKVRAATFSPDSELLAVAIDRNVQVWRSPGLTRTITPFSHVRTFTGHFDNVTNVAWSANSKFILTSSADMTVRLHSILKLKGFVPITLTGHRDTVVGAWFVDAKTIVTVARDASLFVWKWEERRVVSLEQLDESDDSEDERPLVLQKKFTATTKVRASRERHTAPAITEAEEDGVDSMSITQGEWVLSNKHYFRPEDHAKVVSAAFHTKTNMVVVGFSSGIFGLYSLPECSNLHTLSISSHRIQTVDINSSGEWLAFGSRALGQLLVWEWQSETYILKQQGHFYDINTLAYSPDGQVVATGADDGKVKLWSTRSGFCFVTFSQHTAAVTALAFVGGVSGKGSGKSVKGIGPKSKTTAEDGAGGSLVHVGGKGVAVLSASSDGTVRAFDLVRYRNFRTMTTPSPVQFMSLAADPGGEIVCAGCLEPFDIYVWSLQTGRLLDVLSGHEGPVASLDFSPRDPFLASGSWDGTVKVWDVFDKAAATETFDHGSDVLAVAYRPDGAELCGSTRNGNLSFWDVKNGRLTKTVECTKDAAGGRKSTDVRTAQSSAAGKCFSSIAYTPDGLCILAGGRTKYVALYGADSGLLLRKFQISYNRSLEGVLDMLNSKRVRDGQVLDTIDLSDSEDEFRNMADESLPGSKKGDLSSRRVKPEARSKCVRFSPTGQAWAAATTEGLMIYSLDEAMVFDPFELDESVTPENIVKLVKKKYLTRALLMALHLNEPAILHMVVQCIPPSSVSLVAKTLPLTFLQRLMDFVAERIAHSTLIEHYLKWSLELLQHHGPALVQRSKAMMQTYRTLQKSILTHKEGMSSICNENLYTLEFLVGSAGGATYEEDGEASEAGGVVLETKEEEVGGGGSSSVEEAEVDSEEGGEGWNAWATADAAEEEDTASMLEAASSFFGSAPVSTSESPAPTTPMKKSTKEGGSQKKRSSSKKSSSKKRQKV